MTYKTYTHKYIVKNPNEVIENAQIHCLGHADKIQGFSLVAEGTAETILVPGFINLHCHLNYYDLKLKEQKLFLWLKDLLAKTFFDKEFNPKQHALDSIDELMQYGVSYIVENSSNLEASLAAISEKQIKATIGLEVFGSDPQDAQRIFNEAINTIEKFSDANIELCLSPHAIYDVSKELWQLCLEWSKANNRLLLSHIAESQEEEIFTKNFHDEQLKDAKDFWQSIKSLEAKAKNWQSYKNSFDFLYQNKLLYDKLLLAHGVYLDDEALATIAKEKIKLINCPRSNKFLNNDKAQTKKWHQEKIEFAFGTDSRASNYDLDIRKELLENSHLNAQEKFAKLTIDAAKMIGKEHEIGSLKEGKSADFVVLEIVEGEKEKLNLENIFEFVVDPRKTRVKELYIDNKKVFSLKN